MDEQKLRAPRRPNGCVWIVGAVGISLGWILGCLAISLTASWLGASYSNVSPEVRSLLSGAFGSILTVFIPEALGFACAVTLTYSVVILFFLPQPAVGRWVLITFAGGVIYWLFVSLLLSFWRVNGILGFAPMLGDVEGTVFADAPPGSMGVAVGVMIGLVAGSGFAFLQWLVLRRFIMHAAWWLAISVVGSTTFVALLLGYISAILQAGGWN